MSSSDPEIAAYSIIVYDVLLYADADVEMITGTKDILGQYCTLDYAGYQPCPFV